VRENSRSEWAGFELQPSGLQDPALTEREREFAEGEWAGSE